MTLIRAPVRNVGTWARDGKRKGASGQPMRPKVSMLTPGADCFVVAVKLGNASGAKGAGHPIHDRFIAVNRQREEPFDLNEGRRRPSLDDTSRMSREAHVRICERLGV
jgi:hypothetical protein